MIFFLVFCRTLRLSSSHHVGRRNCSCWMRQSYLSWHTRFARQLGAQSASLSHPFWWYELIYTSVHSGWGKWNHRRSSLRTHWSMRRSCGSDVLNRSYISYDGDIMNRFFRINCGFLQNIRVITRRSLAFEIFLMRTELLRIVATTLLRWVMCIHHFRTSAFSGRSILWIYLSYSGWFPQVYTHERIHHRGRVVLTNDALRAANFALSDQMPERNRRSADMVHHSTIAGSSSIVLCDNPRPPLPPTPTSPFPS